MNMWTYIPTVDMDAGPDLPAEDTFAIEVDRKVQRGHTVQIE